VREITGRAHNLHTGDHLYLTDRGWVTVCAVKASPDAEVLVDHVPYGMAGPVLRQVLPWDAPVVVVLAG